MLAERADVIGPISRRALSGDATAPLAIPDSVIGGGSGYAPMPVVTDPYSAPPSVVQAAQNNPAPAPAPVVLPPVAPLPPTYQSVMVPDNVGIAYVPPGTDPALLPSILAWQAGNVAQNTPAAVIVGDDGMVQVSSALAPAPTSTFDMGIKPLNSPVTVVHIDGAPLPVVAQADTNTAQNAAPAPSTGVLGTSLPGDTSVTSTATDTSSPVTTAAGGVLPTTVSAASAFVHTYWKWLLIGLALYVFWK